MTQPGAVPEQHPRHSRFVDPALPYVGVDPRVVVAGEEPVAVEPPARHQDEDAEGRVAEAEPSGSPLGEHADHEVDLLDVAAVDVADLLGQRPVVGEVGEVPRRVEPQEAAEVVVPGDSGLADPQDVGGGYVHEPAVVGPDEALQCAGVVPENDRPGVGGAEREEEVG